MIFLLPQTSRSRKCSIVQEEDDDEDEDGDIDDGSLNRRGSKSEGRINITVQDRLAETERLKKECVAKTVAAVAIAPTRSVFDGICNVKVLTASDMDPNRLGRGGVRSMAGHKIIPRPIDLKCGGGSDGSINDAVFNTIIEPPSPNPIESKSQPQNGERSYSLDCGAGAGAASAFNTAIETRFLTDSATITIPIGSTSSPVQLVNPPKYKTMPSPTRANTILPTGAMCLNEIYEEGTDIGSSDTSTTTTPRPIARHTHFINQQRSASAHQSGSNGGGSPGTAGAHAHRRNKFHKSRTASCSSSDDDDSENRKKRAHKIVDSTKPFQTQRRDSNDDSSDSQDPSGNPACGGAGGGSGGGATGFSMLSGNGNASESTDDHHQQPNADDTDSTHTNDSSNSNGRQQQKSIQGFRRHRTGRRRTGETRLRESQSLNRITEVQESEMPMTLQMPNRSPATLSTGAIDQDNPQSPTASTHSSVLLGTTASQTTHKTSKLGFGARLLQGFKKSDSNSKGNSGHHHHEPKTKHNNNNNHKNNSNNNNDWNGGRGGGGGGGNGNHISSADSNETLHWIKHSKPPLRVKAHQRLKNLKCLVDIFS